MSKSLQRGRFTAASMQHWFDGLEPLIKQIKHYNIYNFDETGFKPATLSYLLDWPPKGPRRDLGYSRESYLD
jgi:hypothetical protein